MIHRDPLTFWMDMDTEIVRLRALEAELAATKAELTKMERAWNVENCSASIAEGREFDAALKLVAAEELLAAERTAHAETRQSRDEALALWAGQCTAHHQQAALAAKMRDGILSVFPLDQRPVFTVSDDPLYADGPKWHPAFMWVETGKLMDLISLAPSDALDAVKREAAAEEMEKEAERWTGSGSVGDSVVRSCLLARAAELRGAK